AADRVVVYADVDGHPAGGDPGDEIVSVGGDRDAAAAERQSVHRAVPAGDGQPALNVDQSHPVVPRSGAGEREGVRAGARLAEAVDYHRMDDGRQWRGQGD